MIKLGCDESLPSGWRWVEAQDVIDVRDGTHDSPAPVDDGVPLVTSKNLVNGAIDFSTCTYISQEDHEAISRRSAVDNGDILYAMIGTIGNPVIVDKIHEFSIKNVALFKFKDDSVFNRYIFHFLNSALAKQQFRSKSRGGTQKFVSLGNMRELEIPLPPLKEQKRIAAILDKADNLRRKRQQAIQLADEFLRSVFLDMFGDPGANPYDYDEVTLENLSSRKMNNGVFRKNDQYGGEIPVAWVSELFRGNHISFRSDGNFINPTEKELNSYGMKYGDILFCRSSLKLEGIGFNNVYLGEDDKALFECHLIRMPPDLSKVNPIFLNYQLRMPNVRKRVFQQSKTVTMTTIDQDGLSKVKVILPPKALQDKFGKICRKLDVHTIKSSELNAVSGDLFSSLSQKAFSGKL
ncbi:restriction endonuclease subunit S [Microbulbifer sp. EKSA008]|uniref:restriction endonuclease subunit S n=1 Tax=Microbulbifer sp. EKSA008 TaxID=3243367 RepID=UPI004041EDBF